MNSQKSGAVTDSCSLPATTAIHKVFDRLGDYRLTSQDIQLLVRSLRVRYIDPELLSLSDIMENAGSGCTSSVCVHLLLDT